MTGAGLWRPERRRPAMRIGRRDVRGEPGGQSRRGKERRRPERPAAFEAFSGTSVPTEKRRCPKVARGRGRLPQHTLFQPGWVACRAALPWRRGRFGGYAGLWRIPENDRASCILSQRKRSKDLDRRGRPGGG